MFDPSGLWELGLILCTRYGSSRRQLNGGQVDGKWLTFRQ